MTRWFRAVSPQSWKAFGAAWLGYAMDGFDFVLITLVLTEVAAEFQLSTVSAASLVSAAFVSRWFGGMAIGALADRFGRRPAMVLSIALYALGSVLSGFAWDYWSLFACRLVIGAGMAGEYTASVSYVLESWPAALRNRASGLLLSGYPLGAVLAAECYALVVPATNWRVLFYLGAVPVLLAIYLRRRLPEAPQWEQERASGGAAGSNAVTLLFTGRRAWWNAPTAAAVAGCLFLLFQGYPVPVLLALVVAVAAGLTALAVQFAGRLWPTVLGLTLTVFCAFLYSWPLQSLLPTYLKTELGFEPDQVTAALRYAGIGYAFGCVLAGFLGDRLGTRRAYVTTLLVSLVFVAPAFALDRDQTWQLWLLLFALQASSQGISGILPKYLAEHFPVAIRGAALGFSYNVGALGGAAAPVLGAALAGPFDLGTAIAALTVALTLAVVTLIGLDVPARLQRRHDRRLAARAAQPVLQERT